MQQAGQFAIPATHPSLPGHFPNHPIVPGVVLLEALLACLPPGLTLLSAKFTAPVLPGDIVTVTSETRLGGRVHFAGAVEGRPVLHGVAGPAS